MTAAQVERYRIEAKILSRPAATIAGHTVKASVAVALFDESQGDCPDADVAFAWAVLRGIAPGDADMSAPGGMTKRKGAASSCDRSKGIVVSDPMTVEMLRRYRAMSPEQRTAALALAKGMAEQREPLRVLYLRFLRAVGHDEVSAQAIVRHMLRPKLVANEAAETRAAEGVALPPGAGMR